MNSSSFVEQIEFSKARLTASPVDTLKSYFSPYCSSVVAGNKQQDKAGVDWIVQLNSGRTVGIDEKRRRPGCSKYWKDGEPELALERWSVYRGTAQPGNVIGWTLDTNKTTEYVLFTFDPEDTVQCFMLPFQLLRLAFLKNGGRWKTERGPYSFQYTRERDYQSASLFVPVKEVVTAVADVMWGLVRKWDSQ